MERRLYRSRTDRMLGGVCSGLGNYFGVDPSLIRLAFVLLTVFGGSGVLLYLILWIVLPEEGRSYGSPEETARANAQEIADRARQMGQEMRTAFGGSSGQTGASDMPVAGSFSEPKPAPSSSASGPWVLGLILVGLGLMFLLNNLFPAFFSISQMWPLILIAIGVAMLIGIFRRQ